ncbi:MAG TPA: M56 and DUF3738 domain-containing protein [Terriglobia bacterium]|nr:M56 and DUF3738 domain-containing protein [Terriglobia bacterium]
MIPRLSAIWSAVAPAMGNHLWQSTLCLVIAGLLTLILRKNHARARYGLWLAASVKFLIPFSLLVGIGSHLARPRVLPPTKPGFFLAVEQVSQPFTKAATGSQAAEESRRPAHDAGLRYRLVHLLQAFLVGMWFCGFAVVLFVWYAHWRRISAALRGAVPLREGREVQALRRLERLGGIRKRIELLLSAASLEPGIFGIVKPVLVWPKGISDHLSDAHLEAILAHEVWHVRRRDNLAAAIHMVVEAIFWFHPLVWWLGARLVEERECACDEEVLESGSKRQVYAESILKACEFCVESPLACVSGVTGADLKKRIFRIMTERGARKLDFRRRLLLSAAGFAVVALPVSFGVANAPQSGSPSQSEVAVATTPRFNVASIKSYKSDHIGWQYGFSITDPPYDGTFYSTDVTVKMLVGMAYGVQYSWLIEGAPSWLDSETFDIQAKADSAVNNQLGKLSPDEGRLVKHRMLQALLVDRFKLALHRETQDLPVYALVIAKNGPKLQESKSGDTPNPIKGSDDRLSPGSMRIGPGQLAGHGIPAAELVDLLSQQLGRTVVDKTGLKGIYDFTIQWTTDQTQAAVVNGPGDGKAGAATAPPSESSGSSLFTAIQEQLGLRLEPQKAPVEVLVIDHVERPSEN